MAEKRPGDEGPAEDDANVDRATTSPEPQLVKEKSSEEEELLRVLLGPTTTPPPPRGTTVDLLEGAIHYPSSATSDRLRLDYVSCQIAVLGKEQKPCCSS